VTLSGIASTLFCLALVSTSATRLRPEGLPVGPGEVLLLTWAVSSCLVAIWGGARHWTVPGWLTATALFWGLALLTLFAGLFQAQASSVSRPAGAGRELVAFGYVAMLMLVVGFIVRDAGMARELLRRYVTVLCVVVAVTLAAAIVFRSSGLGSLWYGGGRFTAFAANPNQLALLLVPVPFLILQLHEDGNLGRITAILCLAAVVVTGIATLSDALALAWLAGGLVSGAILLWKGGNAPGGGLGRVAAIWVLLPAVLVIAAIVAGPVIYPSLESAVTGVVQEGAQASVRVTLWQHGFEALAQAPWTGWGPGAHSGIRGPFEETEAHNSYLDWGASTGVFGLGALVLMLSWAMGACLRGGKTHLFVALLALMLFAVFHFVLRQPAFWLLVLLVAIASSPSRDRGHAGAATARAVTS
jgi:O-antigen ligase